MLRTANTGLNWSVEDARTTLFGRFGSKLVNGRMQLPLSKDSSAMSETHAFSMFDVLVDFVRQDIADGRDRKIDAYGISTVAAIRLALEGVLTEKVLSASEESIGSITVKLSILGKNRKVIIWSPGKDLPDGIESYNAAGQTV